MSEPARVLPAHPATERQVEDSERALLAILLCEGIVAVDRAVDLIQAAMFSRTPHARLFRVLEELARAGTAIDPVTVSEALRNRGELEAIGGTGFLGGLMEEYVTGSAFEYHVERIRGASQRRRLVSEANAIIQAAYDSPLSADALLEDAAHRVQSLKRHGGASSFVPLKAMLWSALEGIDKRRMSEGGLTGVPTGFPALDALTLGWQSGDLIVLAGRPSMGKTAFALNTAAHAVLRAEVPTAVASLEMSSGQLIQRLLATEGGLDLQRVRRGQFTADEDANLARAAGQIGVSPLWIDDTAGMTLHMLTSRARQLHASCGLGLLVVDYLQLLEGAPQVESRQVAVASISRGLKGLAKELNIPVVVLSQLSRSVEQRTDHRPMLSDLRESGAIEQDADVVCFLYRPEYYESAGPWHPDGTAKCIPGTSTPMPGYAELIIAKQRNGPTGAVPLLFTPERTLFRDPSAPAASTARPLRLVRG